MGNFWIRQVPSGYKFHLKAANGETIAVSESYSSAAQCRRGLERLGKIAPDAKLEDLTGEGEKPVSNPKFQLYGDKSGHFRFRLRSRNGEIIASSQPYTTKAACLAGIESVRINAPTAAESPVEME